MNDNILLRPMTAADADGVYRTSSEAIPATDEERQHVMNPTANDCNCGFLFKRMADDSLELFGCGPAEVVQVDFMVLAPVFTVTLLDEVVYALDRGPFFGERYRRA